MAKKIKQFSDGKFTLQKSGFRKEFLFFRNDNQVLGEVPVSKLIQMFKEYMKRASNALVIKLNEEGLVIDESYDGKCLILNFDECMEFPKSQSLIRRIVNKMFA